jgi:hypothetical protein
VHVTVSAYTLTPSTLPRVPPNAANRNEKSTNRLASQQITTLHKGIHATVSLMEQTSSTRNAMQHAGPQQGQDQNGQEEMPLIDALDNADQTPLPNSTSAKKKIPSEALKKIRDQQTLIPKLNSNNTLYPLAYYILSSVMCYYSTLTTRVLYVCIFGQLQLGYVNDQCTSTNPCISLVGCIIS